MSIAPSALPVFLALALLSSGCGSVATYFKNRAGDFSDAVQVAVGAPAIGGHLEATALLATGLDGWSAYGKEGGSFGNFQSRAPAAEEFAGYSVILLHARGVDTHPMARDPFNDRDFPPFHDGTITHAFELSRAFTDEVPPENLRWTRWLDVEVDAALVIGARARLSPGELLDFLLGWWGLDLAGDDQRADKSLESALETR
ncbi:MAG: hypothetical protein HY717_15005 [Planctomycetes bacterium]|nr:hypothetical protein [Planctomycetota bacterium]